MITTAAIVTMIAALGWLVLNWRGYRSDVAAAGLSRNTQLQMALIWVVIIAGLTLIVRYFSP